MNIPDVEVEYLDVELGEILGSLLMRVVPPSQVERERGRVCYKHCLKAGFWSSK